MKALIVGTVICVLGVGCASSSMTLKRLDRDIPSALVKEYSAKESPYVDEGKAWCLPLLGGPYSEAYVAKTEMGFQASWDGGFVLGLLLSAGISSDFDPKGQLTNYESQGSLLTGLLLSERTTILRKGEDLKKGHARSVLWGAFGFSEEPNGAKKLSLLWIPIPVSRGK